MAEMQEMGFAAACKKVFEKRPGQTSVEFVKELKELTPADRLELGGLFEKECGIRIIKAK